MSQKIPRNVRNTDWKKTKLKCINCKYMLVTHHNMPKWKCHINNWTNYDVENDKCKYFIERKNKIILKKR